MTICLQSYIENDHHYYLQLISAVIYIFILFKLEVSRNKHRWVKYEVAYYNVVCIKHWSGSYYDLTKTKDIEVDDSRSSGAINKPS